MSAETLTSRLDKVRRTGNDRWISRCPAHDDHGPSLAIRELEDGRVLLHCFAGCETSSVLGALGLTFEDLFPQGPSDVITRKERRPFMAGDILRCLAYEALYVYQCATALSKGEPLSDQDRGRLLVAVSRFQRGVEVANG